MTNGFELTKQFKFGLRPAKRAAVLGFEQFWSGITPEHPIALDYLKKLTAWNMLGNDVYGDCVAAGSANFTRLITSALGTEYYAPLAEVLRFYKTQNPNFPTDDNGMEMQTALEEWHARPYFGHQLVAFAAVDPQNVEQIKAAIAIFGGVLVGTTVLQANLTEFDKNEPWNYVARSQSVGGHCVLAGGYAASKTRDVNFITWAQETVFTDTFIAHEWQECWIPILPEHLGTKQFQQGVDLAAMQAAYLALTGQVLNVPTPPVPTSKGWSVTIQTTTHLELDLK